MNELSQQKCVPCQGGEAPLTATEISTYQQQVPDWRVVKENHIFRLKRSFKLKNFAEAINFIQQIAAIAEAEQHHPNLYLHNYNQLEIELYTHKIGGLHANDFILASKIDKLEQK